jgi:membrane fusion protein (multidrug efflux system)
MRNPVRGISPLTPLLAAVAWLAGCKPSQAPGGAAGGPGGMAVRVVAVEVRPRPVAEVVPLVGTLAANESVEVKAEADGVVKRVAFDEGGRVEAGALLVALDDTKFTASLREAEAALQLSAANAPGSSCATS